jgi:hypothetical protein
MTDQTSPERPSAPAAPRGDACCTPTRCHDCGEVIEDGESFSDATGRSRHFYHARGCPAPVTVHGCCGVDRCCVCGGVPTEGPTGRFVSGGRPILTRHVTRTGHVRCYYRCERRTDDDR